MASKVTIEGIVICNYMKVSGILPLVHSTVNFIESCYGCGQYKTFL